MCGSLLTAPDAQGQSLTISDPHDLLATNYAAFVQFLEDARPPAVTHEAKALVLKSLPPQGEITVLGATARKKLAALTPVLRTAQRDSVYEIKIIDVPQTAIGIYARAVVLISEPALALLDVDELRALVAHEIGHEYVWVEFELAASRGDARRLRQLELVCDGIAIAVLHQLGMETTPLIGGFEKMIQFNRITLGAATNESNYPTLPQRREFARKVEAWAAGASRVP